jgi:hypothetical protein
VKLSQSGSIPATISPTRYPNPAVPPGNDLPPGMARWRRLTLGTEKHDVDLDQPPQIRTNPYGVFCDELLVLSRTLDHLRFLVADPAGLLPHHRPTAIEAISVIGARLEQVAQPSDRP